MQPTRTPDAPAAEDFRVLIAGGGVGGLEAILALRELAPRIRIELLSPAESFVLAPLSVAEPFGSGPPPELPLDQFCADHGVEWTREELAEIWPQQRRALDAGAELPYDALLLCPGARRRNTIGGAITFRGGAQSEAVENLVAEAGERGGKIVFVVPPGPSWPLLLYELMWLVADRLRDAPVTIEVRTPEHAPLQILGHAGSEKVLRGGQQANATLHCTRAATNGGVRWKDSP